MARFYQASSPEVIDYIPDVGGASRSGASGKTQSPFGELDVIPEDRPRLQEKMGQYYSEVQSLAEELRQNPKDLARFQPRIADLRRRIADDYSMGEIASMRDRKKQYDEIYKSFSTTYKNHPLELSYAMGNMEIEPLNYDPVTGTAGKVMAPKMAVPWSDDMWQNAIKNANDSIMPQLVKEAETKNIPINRYSNAVQIMNALGYTEDQALQGIVANLSPEAVDSFNQHYRLRGVELPDFAVDGQLNPEHPLVKQLQGWAKGKAGISDLKIDTRQGTDYGKKAAVEKTDKGPGENATANYYAEGFERVLELAKQPEPNLKIPEAGSPLMDDFLLNQVIKVADEDGKTAAITLKGTVIHNGKPYAVIDEELPPNSGLYAQGWPGSKPPGMSENVKIIQITPELLNSILGDKDFRDFWDLVKGKYPSGKSAAKTTAPSSTPAPAKKSAKDMLK